MLMKSIILLFLTSFISCVDALSSSSVSTSTQSSSKYVWNLERGDLAIEGYDAVAYFLLHENNDAVKGSSKFSYKWKGATWKFSSKENLEKFKSNPTKYIPQYGGYCAYAAARNYLYSIDPNAWTVKNNKLYLNATKSLRTKWFKNIDSEIKKADRNWPGLSQKK